MNIFQHCNSLKRLPFTFEPNIWKEYLDGNRYEYLLNFCNSTTSPLTIGSILDDIFQPYYSNQELINILCEKLNILGFTVEQSNNRNNVPYNKMKFLVSRSRCGDYHFYRLDSNGFWSHKLAFDLPSNLDFSGNTIILPENACSTDISVGYFLLGFQ